MKSKYPRLNMSITTLCSPKCVIFCNPHEQQIDDYLLFTGTVIEKKSLSNLIVEKISQSQKI